MNSYEFTTVLKCGKKVVIGYTLDGYKSLLDFIEDLDGNEIIDYDDCEVYELISVDGMNQWLSQSE